MKTKLVLTVILTSFLFLYGCSDNDDTTEESELISQSTFSSKISNEGKGSSVTSQAFPQAKQEVIETFEAIAQSIIDGDMDLLISFHAYGPKFTEFKDGALRNGGEANEAYERTVFGSVTEVVRFDANDLQVAVYYGNVANVTFHSDFRLRFGEGTEPVIINNQITLLFVKTKGKWKIVHEHHSPLL
ncbi:nuclear transport factor 2 family protein [Gramella sp. AN32]|uniref:YybH family protein n=1 Tax=Christiangramia antarctica TaxID=2058158 RepID=A0ABW5X740_9FLAO|nr:nuclear transport factor 2 family protein [Gramella sp. AN32]MCM4155337.1 hypothetical protein [Gramella sp. AN32]